MANEDKFAPEDVSKVEGHSIIEIPVDKTEAVLEFISTLETEDADISGYMISRGGFGGFSAGSLAAKQPTETGCVKTGGGMGGIFGTDWNCSDTDSITTQ